MKAPFVFILEYLNCNILGTFCNVRCKEMCHLFQLSPLLNVYKRLSDRLDNKLFWSQTIGLGVQMLLLNHPYTIHFGGAKKCP